MNMLENYIVEVHDVETYNAEWTKEDWAKDKTWVEVDHTTNCYGSKTRSKRVYELNDWEATLKQGYYWA
ncbi:hypothetical protein [Exiguobacterium sp. AB2]|uniref:hypothetical protein n=1 Tax=Exiguobacterium sp. AB2 TaxID=1484479 RepID=UPI0004A93D12|nr:hypothetical protein [Exiguobacterium sp. AB2]KDN58472.1 hypothetical protein DI14_04890 [Exiguobacterium sp. AB2]